MNGCMYTLISSSAFLPSIKHTIVVAIVIMICRYSTTAESLCSDINFYVAMLISENHIMYICARSRAHTHTDTCTHVQHACQNPSNPFNDIINSEIWNQSCCYSVKEAIQFCWNQRNWTNQTFLSLPMILIADSPNYCGYSIMVNIFWISRILMKKKRKRRLIPILFSTSSRKVS